ncbi:S8 family peptidase [Aquimarina aggregata]|uniref:S8 family peptidase n=1 Tax=Aquimarina aggregata TaxID=1642818 RepID=UPI00248FE227|nr:S8 family peptidase [Aquimarina aggregata]
MKYKLIYPLLICLFGCCTKRQPNHLVFDVVTVLQKKNNTLSEDDLRNWQFKDIINDTIPGVSLEKAYTSILKNKIGNELIVAVLDTEVDINHEDLEKQIWINPDEIPDNNIDDDENGYIDDIHGWNFLGNAQGESMINANYEYVRVVRKYKEIFDKNLGDTFSSEYKEYRSALSVYEKKREEAQLYLDFALDVTNKYEEAKAKVKEYVPNQDYSLKNLKKIDTIGNDLGPYVKSIYEIISYGYTEADIKKLLTDRRTKLERRLNLDYNERSVTNDNSNTILDVNYGNNKVSNHIDELSHGTLMSGVIAATRDNDIGIQGISNHIKVMPVCISPKGDEHDKDIALGIRYAVDNGAQIINMSFGKQFSLHKEWVFDAIKYASEKDVLIVSSAGNNGLDLEIIGNNYYPNDHIDNEEEIANNFIMVGAITNQVDHRLLASYSNYGKKDIDLFAPGSEIYTTLPKNKYKTDSGTSMASAIVSGVAALVRSYYPKLSANQVKEILMKSGTSYAIKVKISSKDEKSEKMIPFSELSKSGKVINAYNALLLADRISNPK